MHNNVINGAGWRSDNALNSYSRGVRFEFQLGHLRPHRSLSCFSSVPPHNFEQEWNGDRQGKTEETWMKSLCQCHFFHHESVKK
jgi:hypothetical protein